MKAIRKAIRSWLETCTRTDLDAAMFNARLTNSQREVIEMKFTQGISIIDISVERDTDPSVIKKRLFKDHTTSWQR